MFKAASLFLFFGLALGSCKTSDSPQANSETLASSRSLIVPLTEVAATPFDFCPEKRAINLKNNMWLSFLSANQYSHWGVVGPMLEKLGFGDKGEGDAYLKAWWELRIKRIQEGRPDTDDAWGTPQERVKLENAALASYQSLFGKPFVSDGIDSIKTQENLVGGKKPEAKIQFISGLSAETGTIEKTSTQVLYAEHSKINLSVVSFRGTEGEEGPDRVADLKLTQVKFDGFGFVHAGFYEAYQQVDAQLLKTLRTRSAAKPMNLWITGHSLGAALSTIFTARVMDLQAKGDLPNVRLVGTYNVGSPRVFDVTGSTKFDELIVKNKVNFVRFRNHKDLVTGIPTGIPGAPASYWHVGALGYYNATGKLFYGDGWASIEKDSDILTSLPTEVGDHDVAKYFKFAKGAIAASTDAVAKGCAPAATDKPLAPFRENPKSRT